MNDNDKCSIGLNQFHSFYSNKKKHNLNPITNTMKKSMLFLACAAAAMSMSAQQQVVKDAEKAMKSGKDYTVHSALNHFLSNESYGIKKGYVLSNERVVTQKGKVIYMPIYYVMFFQNS